MGLAGTLSACLQVRHGSLSRFCSGAPYASAFTSSSTVKNFLSIIVGTEIPAKLGEIKFASIGPVTSDTLREYGLPVHAEADEYTMEGLAQALVRLFDR